MNLLFLLLVVPVLARNNDIPTLENEACTPNFEFYISLVCQVLGCFLVFLHPYFKMENADLTIANSGGYALIAPSIILPSISFWIATGCPTEIHLIAARWILGAWAVITTSSIPILDSLYHLIQLNKAHDP
jgi:hypothetical protein